MQGGERNVRAAGSSRTIAVCMGGSDTTRHDTTTRHGKLVEVEVDGGQIHRNVGSLGEGAVTCPPLRACQKQRRTNGNNKIQVQVDVHDRSERDQDRR